MCPTNVYIYIYTSISRLVLPSKLEPTASLFRFLEGPFALRIIVRVVCCITGWLDEWSETSATRVAWRPAQLSHRWLRGFLGLKMSWSREKNDPDPGKKTPGKNTERRVQKYLYMCFSMIWGFGWIWWEKMKRNVSQSCRTWNLGGPLNNR